MPAAKKTEGAGPARSRPKAKVAETAAKPIGIEPVVRVGGHVATEDGWVPEED